MNVRLFAILLLLFSVSTSSSASSASEKYALLIGVTKYEHAQMNRTQLKYPEADATAVAELLEKSGYTVKLLTGKQATQKAVTDAIAACKSEGTADGVVLIGLFGHGVQYGDEAFYGPYDTEIREVKDSQGNSLRDKAGNIRLEPDPGTMVSMRSILDALTVCGAENKVLLADCCREDPSVSRVFGSNLRKEGLPRGMAALFACSENEQAFESDEWGHGAFTKALIEELQDSQRVTASTLSDTLYEKVKLLVSEKTNGKQNQSVNGIVNGFVDLKLQSETPQNIVKEDYPWKGETRVRLVRTIMVGGEKIEFVKVPKGSFLMGAAEADEVPNSEKPQHKVIFTYDLWVSKYPVTRKQFEAFVDQTGYRTGAETFEMGGSGFNEGTGSIEESKDYNWRNTGWKQSDQHPVVNVNWLDASEFTAWAKRESKLEIRLLSEAEYEYAHAGGMTTKLLSGDDAASLEGYANVADESALTTWNCSWSTSFDDGEPFTSPVGKYKPNGFGLYDMSGNVKSWCEDTYSDSGYEGREQVNPRAARDFDKDFRSTRGSDWRQGGEFMMSRVAYRQAYGSVYCWCGLGFRVCFRDD